MHEHEIHLPNVNRHEGEPEHLTFRRFIEPERVTLRAQEIAEHILDNTPAEQPLIFLPVLHGALDFTLRVRNAITQLNHRREPTIRALAASSYGSGMKGGLVRITHMPNLEDLQHYAGFLFEDIVDTGNTIRHVQPLLAQQLGCLSVATLLQKRQGIDALLTESRPPAHGSFGQPLPTSMPTRDPITVHYAAFEICDDAFVIGEGLDYANKGRGLKGIYHLVDPMRATPKVFEPDFQSMHD